MNLNETAADQSPQRTNGIFYGWILAGLGALLMAIATAPLYHGLPVWNPVLRNTFGWTAGQMSWAYAMIQIEGFYGPLIGLLVDKVGPRLMVFVGLVIGGIGFVLFSQIQELWHLYFVFLILSLGVSAGSWLPIITVMNHWFTRHKTRAISLVMEGFAVSGVILPLLLAWAIGGSDPNVSERFGWRNSALFIGIVCLASAIPITLLMKNRPSDLGLRPDGDPAFPDAVSQVDSNPTQFRREDYGYTLQEAIRTKAFWFMSLAQAATNIVLGTIFVHLGLLMDDRGFSLQSISIVWAVYTTVSAISILVGGYLGDRFSMRLVVFVLTTLLTMSILVLMLAQNMAMFFIFAVLFGAGTGRIPVLTAMRGVYFGSKAFAAITGISMVPANILLVVAPIYAGSVRDAYGTYDVPFLTIAAVSFLGSFLFLFLGEPTKRSPQTALPP